MQQCQKGETKRSASVWSDQQHRLYPSCRPARPPKPWLTKPASLNSSQYATRWAAVVPPARSRDLPEYQRACVVRMRNIQLFHDGIDLHTVKSLLNGIPKFVLKIGQNFNFVAFHLGVKVSETFHKLYSIIDLSPYCKV